MKPPSFPWILSLLLLFSMRGISYAQSERQRFDHLTEQQGLSQNSVWSIHQDREGFMWFGTRDGLNKYDGYTFTVFKPDPKDPENTLHHNIITDIHEDRKGRLWVATLGGGFHQVDKNTGKVTRYGMKPSNTIIWNVLVSIYEDKEGLLWICGMGGVALFDPETKQFSLYAAPAEPSIIAAVTEDSAGRLWAGGEGGVYHLNRSTGKFSPVVLDSTLSEQPDCFSLYLDKEGILWAGTRERELFKMDTRSSSLRFTRYNPDGLVFNNSSYVFHDIYQDAHGYLWISGGKGIQRIDKQTDQVLSFQTSPFQPGNISHHNASTFYQDRTGNLWIGTDNGVIKVTPHSKQFHYYQVIPAFSSVLLNQNKIGTILEDHTGKIWLGNAGGFYSFSDFATGLYQFDPKSRQFRHFPANASDPDSLTSNEVWSVYEDQANRLWIGTTEALHLFDRKTGKFSRYLSEIPVEHIAEDREGKLWIGGRQNYPSYGGIASFDPGRHQFKYYKYDPQDSAGLKDWNPWDIMVSRSGDIWVALSGGGIARLNQETDQFTSYFPPLTTSPGHLNDKDVRALYEDADGVIWAGTNQGGLHRFDSLTNNFTYYTIHDGLPSNHILSIIGDAKGNLWMGTNKGISRFNPETEVFRNFDVSDGLPANEFNLGSVYSRKGKLMFGSVNGFVIFHPDSIKDNTMAPPVYITGFKVLEESRGARRESIELPYDENFLSFDFVALNYDSPEKNQYAYKLEGVDKDWIYSGTRRFASYTNLDPGEYIFRVKASNNDGVWNEQGASMQITILPPWWQTWWAYSLYGILAIGFLYGLRQYTVKRERLKHELKLQRLEAEKMHEVDHLKSRFFANISHEFRTPLTLILGPLEKFISSPSDEKPDKSVYQMMHRNARRLLHLINQLLDLSKLEAGSMKLETKPADLVSFLKAMVLSFSSLAERRQIQYHFQYPQEHPVMYFDADKLEKIIVNLLSNAFKFTPVGGEITVTAHLNPAEEQALPASFRKAGSSSGVNMLELKVRDSGTGIADDQKERIFDRFYQIDTSRTREQEGSGIGLSLVRELVELHEGEVFVESQVGKGSCFTVRLPLLRTYFEQVTVGEQAVENGQSSIALLKTAEEEVQLNLTSAPEITETGTDIPLVLIIEDNADIRQFIRQHLYPAYQVIGACNGLAGYTSAIETIPDLILSDVMMPKMDGVELCRKLKANEKTAHIPVILLTAKASGEGKIEGLETGADDYIIKPFEAAELLVRIKNLIESRRKLREHFSREIILQPASIAITSVDEQFLQRVMQIIEAHMSDTSFGVEAFGREAGMSRVQLFRKLKALTNHSPGDFVRIMRMKRAAELLSHGAGTIAEVDFLVGFNEPSYFTKCFQKEFGQTPSEFMAAGTH